MTWLNKLCLILSVYVLAALGWQTFGHQTAAQYKVLNYIDFGVCFVFLADFIQRFRRAENKTKFMKWGWIDLICSIPAFGPISWDKYYHVLRMVRASRSLKYIVDIFCSHKATSKFVDCCIISVAFLFFSAIGVFNCEKHAEGANIKTTSDAIWWSMATITTIGYGDRYPVSDCGRAFAVFVMVGGVGLYASFTGFIVSKFINDDRIDTLLVENKLLHDKIDKLIASNRADRTVQRMVDGLNESQRTKVYPKVY